MAAVVAVVGNNCDNSNDGSGVDGGGDDSGCGDSECNGNSSGNGDSDGSGKATWTTAARQRQWWQQRWRWGEIQQSTKKGMTERAMATETAHQLSVKESGARQV
jgi:hypothetical protein